MKICIFGAGAIGGYMGVKLAQIGTDVSLVARGPHLEAMKKNGLRLIEGESDLTVPVEASDSFPSPLAARYCLYAACFFC